jgi:ABC-2 type transport system ATP-binding protein
MERAAAVTPETRDGAPAPVLEGRELVKRFGDRVAVREVSLIARPGDHVAVIGPNGAGKTTLLSMLAGDQRPDSGEIRHSTAGVGWVPQLAAVYGKLTVAENLRLFARLERCRNVEAAVDRMLDQTRLGDRADDPVATLSGGNRQRVNVAIGLLSEPSVLLLDEPSTGLDPRQRERLWEFLLGLSDDGTAVVFSTHNIQEAERYGRELVVLADGELLFTGSPSDLEGAVGTGRARDFESAFVAFLRERGH